MRVKTLIKFLKSLDKKANISLYIVPKGDKNKYYKKYEGLIADSDENDIKIDLDRSLDVAFLSTQQGCYERNMDLGLFISDDKLDAKIHNYFYKGVKEQWAGDK